MEDKLTRIFFLASEIEVEATVLDKRPRHFISDAAKLIQWVCRYAVDSSDPETTQAIDNLASALKKNSERILKE